jgi:hypothetical protein
MEFKGGRSMRVKDDVNEKGSVRVARLLVVLSVMSLAVIFLLAFTNVALAQGKMQGDRGTLTGEVIALDHVHNPTTMTLVSSQIGQFPNNQLNIFLSRDTKVQICKASESSKDISVSRNATVTYHEVGGVAVANRISEQC